MFSNLPSPTVVIASSSQWANAFTSDWIIFVYIGVGVIAAFILIRWLISMFISGLNRLTQPHGRSVDHTDYGVGSGHSWDDLRDIYNMRNR